MCFWCFQKAKKCLFLVLFKIVPVFVTRPKAFSRKALRPNRFFGIILVKS